MKTLQPRSYILLAIAGLLLFLTSLILTPNTQKSAKQHPVVLSSAGGFWEMAGLPPKSKLLLSSLAEANHKKDLTKNKCSKGSSNLANSVKRVAGAGDPSYNGDYTGPDPKGPWVYHGSAGDRFLYFDATQSALTYFLYTSVANSGRGDYDQGYGTNAAKPDTSAHAWEAQSGAAPAPTVTDVTPVTVTPPRNLRGRFAD